MSNLPSSSGRYVTLVVESVKVMVWGTTLNTFPSKEQDTAEGWSRTVLSSIRKDIGETLPATAVVAAAECIFAGEFLYGSRK